MLNPADWVKKYGNYLLTMAGLRVGNKETAEDLVQETFVSAIRARDSFKGDSSEKTWLVAILKNKIIDHYRKKDVLRDTSQYLAQTDDEFNSHFFNGKDGHWLREAAPNLWPSSADAELNSEEFNLVVRHCVHRMPPALVPIFIARFIDEDDSKTICKVHGISSSNYWVIIHRAKILIRSCLEKNWFMKSQ